MGTLNKLIDGTYPDEMTLSLKRAKVIVAYLVKRGIDPERLKAKGYGYAKPIIKNAKTIKEKKINVRAEIMILSVNYHKEVLTTITR